MVKLGGVRLKMGGILLVMLEPAKAELAPPARHRAF